MTYNGHKNRNFWNVALWLFNDYGLYSLMREAVAQNRGRDAAARYIQESLREAGHLKTPDGAPYSFSAIRAAIAKCER